MASGDAVFFPQREVGKVPRHKAKLLQVDEYKSMFAAERAGRPRMPRTPPDGPPTRPGAVAVAGNNAADMREQQIRDKQEREDTQRIAVQLGMSEAQMQALDDAERSAEAEAELYLKAFEEYDEDGSGDISPDELRKVLVSLGETGDIDEIITEADTDGDGTINYEEFVNLMKARKRMQAMAKSLSETRGESVEANEVTAANAVPEAYRKYMSALPPLKLPTPDHSRKMHRGRGRGRGGFGGGGGGRRRRRGHTGHAAQGGEGAMFVPRKTPHVLRSGMQVNQDLLRRELALANSIVKEMDAKVNENVQWVQENCNVTSLRAQLYCKRWGMQKLQNIMRRIEFKDVMAALKIWKKFVLWSRSNEHVEQYMKLKGSRRLTSLFANWKRKRTIAALDTWWQLVEHQRNLERHAAAVQIQRIARGFVSRLRADAARRGRAATHIQRIFRGHRGRQYMSEVREHLRRTRAACFIQRCYRGFEGKKLSKMMLKAHRERVAATRIQGCYRARVARKRVRELRNQRLRQGASVNIQRVFRGFVARQIVWAQQQAIAETTAAVWIQTFVRGYFGRIHGLQLMETRMQLVAEDEAALKIQTVFRGHRARIVVARMRLERSAIAIQTRWRAHRNQKDYRLYRLQRAQEFERRREAAIRVQSTARGKLARDLVAKRRAAEAIEQKAAAERIQAIRRGQLGRREYQTKQQAFNQALREQRREEERLAEERKQVAESTTSIAAVPAPATAKAELEDQARAKPMAAQTAQDDADAEDTEATPILQPDGPDEPKPLAETEQVAPAAEAAQAQASAPPPASAAPASATPAGAAPAAPAAPAAADSAPLQASTEEAEEAGEEEEAPAELLSPPPPAHNEHVSPEEHAAMLIQRHARGALCRKELVRRESTIRQRQQKSPEERAAELERAAIMIQKHVRAKLARSHVRAKHAAAAAKALHELQERERRHREEEEEKLAAIKMQGAWRVKHAQELAEQKRALKEKQAQQEAAAAAEALQKRLQEEAAHKAQLEREAALQKQIEESKNAEDRARLEEEQRRQNAATTIQGFMRMIRDRAFARRDLEERRRLAKEAEALAEIAAAVKIQSVYRSKKERVRAQEIKERLEWEAANQARARKQREAEERRQADAELRAREEEVAALKLQAVIRAQNAKREVDELRTKALLEKLKLKADEEAKREQARMEESALRIQCAFRTRRAQRELTTKLKLHQARLAELREKGEREEELERLQEKQEQEIAAAKMQNLYRAKVARLQVAQVRAKQEREQAEERAQAEERLKEISARRIQALYRGWRDRREMRRKAARPPSRPSRPGTAGSSRPGSRESGRPGSRESGQSGPGVDPYQDWVEYWDDSSQAYYYFNTVTQEARWTDPRHDESGYHTAGSPVDYGSDNFDPNYGIHSGYDGCGQEQGYYDEYGQWQSGYYDAYGQWVATTPAVAAGDPADWEEYYDDSYQASYYFNVHTFETVWEPPPGFVSQYADPHDAPRYEG